MGHYEDQYRADKEEKEYQFRTRLNDVVEGLEHRVEKLRDLSRGSMSHRGRDLSVAITHIETAILWLKK